MAKTESLGPMDDSTQASKVMTSEEREIFTMIAAKRAAMPPYIPPTPVANLIPKAVSKAPRVLTPEQIDKQKKLEAEDREWQKQAEHQIREGEKRRWWARYIAAAGKRYENCRLDNFEAESPAQRKAITKIRAFAAKLADEIAAGHNLLIHGPVGTGKDHVLTGLIWLAIQAYKTVEWRDGATMYAEWRDAMDRNTSEQSLIERLIEADVLAISDPVPGRSAITDFQAERLGKIIDARYRNNRPTWITSNVSSIEQLESLTSARFTDRFADDNCLRVFFNWESWRQRGRGRQQKNKEPNP